MEPKICPGILCAQCQPWHNLLVGGHLGVLGVPAVAGSQGPSTSPSKTSSILADTAEELGRVGVHKLPALCK